MTCQTGILVTLLNEQLSLLLIDFFFLRFLVEIKYFGGDTPAIDMDGSPSESQALTQLLKT